MQYTLRQACQALNGVSHSINSVSVEASINEAIVSLSGFKAWDRLRKVIHLKTHTPTFTLPQDVATITRACLNGNPTSVMSQYFRFLSSGPGDLSTLPKGYNYISSNVQELGRYPTMLPISTRTRLLVASDGGADDREPGLVIIGHDGDRIVTEQVDNGSVSESYFTDISSVTLTGEGKKYILLSTVDEDSPVEISSYHPSVLVPEYKRYRIVGNKKEVYDLLLEVQINPLPLIRPTDVIPFASLDPIRHMMMANWHYAAGEVDSGTKYQNLAIQQLEMSDAVEDTKQTFTVVNSIYRNSLGEMSDRYTLI